MPFCFHDIIVIFNDLLDRIINGLLKTGEIKRVREIKRVSDGLKFGQ